MNTIRKKTLAIVSGALANKPFNGGNAWTRLSWVVGLQRLGCDVLFLEEISPEACVDRTGCRCAFEASVNRSYFEQTIAEFGLQHNAALLSKDGQHSWGRSLPELAVLAREAQLLVNISGHLTLPQIKDSIACKVYFDDDPGFTQFWHASGYAGARLYGHDFYYTIGENIGAPDCSIPVGELEWRHTRPPVVLDQWPVAATNGFNRFTTVASWRGAYGPVTYGGKTYGLKVHEFRKYLELPQRTKNRFEIALQIHSTDQKDLNSLHAHDWEISDPVRVAGCPGTFRNYVHHSSAEFSVAQGIYVDTNSGWFSDRSVRYLASGRPVLVQDTGFSRNYSVGEGLLAFRTIEEAQEGVERITAEYGRHCRAARQLAEEYFDSGKVIRQLTREVGFGLS